MLAAYSEIIMHDATYKVNNLRTPLFSLAIVDQEVHGQPMAHTLARENEEHISLFLEHVVKREPRVKFATFIMDKDVAEIIAVKRVCSNASVFLCRLHIMKTFTEEPKRQPKDNSETLLAVCYLMLLSCNSVIAT